MPTAGTHGGVIEKTGPITSVRLLGCPRRVRPAAQAPRHPAWRRRPGSGRAQHCPATRRCFATALSVSSYASSCADPMCSMSRDRRREECTTDVRVETRGHEMLPGRKIGRSSQTSAGADRPALKGATSRTRLLPGRPAGGEQVRCGRLGSLMSSRFRVRSGTAGWIGCRLQNRTRSATTCSRPVPSSGEGHPPAPEVSRR
jgi:hypothetical protein